MAASREAIRDDVERVLDVERTRRRELRDLIKSSLFEDLTDAQQHILKRQGLGLVLRVQDLEKCAGQRSTGSTYKRLGAKIREIREWFNSRGLRHRQRNGFSMHQTVEGGTQYNLTDALNEPAGSGREKLATLDTSADVCSSRHPEIILTSAGISFSACSRADDMVTAKTKRKGRFNATVRKVITQCKPKRYVVRRSPVAQRQGVTDLQKVLVNEMVS